MVDAVKCKVASGKYLGANDMSPKIPMRGQGDVHERMQWSQPMHSQGGVMAKDVVAAQRLMQCKRAQKMLLTRAQCRERFAFDVHPTSEGEPAL
ncbi:MAG: hypothetical protein WCO59_05460 [Actinomycetes bacterium]